MSDDARRVYQRFGDFFLVVGGVFFLIGVVRAVFVPDLLRGDPTQVAVLLLAIGGGLRWTVRKRPEDEDGEAAEGELEERGDADEPDARHDRGAGR